MLSPFRAQVALVRGQNTSAAYQEAGHRPHISSTQDPTYFFFPLDVEQKGDPAQSVRFPGGEYYTRRGAKRRSSKNIRFGATNITRDVERTRDPAKT